ncbi:MAG: hypothetical protein AB7Q17_14815 [Phycisphaerae bacterium]
MNRWLQFEKLQMFGRSLNAEQQRARDQLYAEDADWSRRLAPGITLGIQSAVLLLVLLVGLVLLLL